MWPDKDEGDAIIQKISSDSLSINGQTFTFDSVADTETTQLDIFELVGVPLVENCLAGFNSSVFVYGQTGSGKTYTMWGPANALSEENFTNDQKGLTPVKLSFIFENSFTGAPRRELLSPAPSSPKQRASSCVSTIFFLSFFFEKLKLSFTLCCSFFFEFPEVLPLFQSIFFSPN